MITGHTISTVTTPTTKTVIRWPWMRSKNFGRVFARDGWGADGSVSWDAVTSATWDAEPPSDGRAGPGRSSTVAPSPHLRPGHRRYLGPPGRPRHPRAGDTAGSSPAPRQAPTRDVDQRPPRPGPGRAAPTGERAPHPVERAARSGAEGGTGHVGPGAHQREVVVGALVA